MKYKILAGHDFFKHNGLEISKEEESIDSAEVFLIYTEFKIDEKGTQDITELKNAIKKVKQHNNRPFLVFSETIPKTIDHLKKFYKMQLVAARHTNINTGYIGITEDPVSSVFHEKIMLELFGDDFVIKAMPNRQVEFCSLWNKIKECIDCCLCDLNNEYTKKASIYDTTIKSEKIGFDARHTKYLIALTKEMDRFGLMTASLKAINLENMIRRAFPNQELPPPELVIPEKTKEKLRSIAQ